MASLQAEWTRIYSSVVARNAAWMFLGQGLSVFCQAAYFILLGRLLGSTEYGVYVGALAMVSIVGQFSPFGSHSVLLRYVSPEPRNFAPYWGNVLVTTIGLGSVFVVLLTLLGSHFASGYSRTMLFCIATAECVCTPLTIASGRVFQAFENMRVTAAVSLLVNLLRSGMAGILLLQFHHGTATQWSLASLLTSMVAACTSLALVASCYGKPSLSPALLRNRLGEGFIFALSYSTTGIYNDLDKAILGHCGMNAANGIYTMAYRVIDVAAMPVVSIQGAAFPRFFCKGKFGVSSTTSYAVQLIKRTAPLALFCGLAAILGGSFIPALLGKSFAESSSAIRWLCFLPVFRAFHLTAGDALTAAGKQTLRLYSQATAAIFNLAINLYLIPHYSWLGAAWSSLMTDGLLAVFTWVVLGWLASVEVRDRSREGSADC